MSMLSRRDFLKMAGLLLGSLGWPDSAAASALGWREAPLPEARGMVAEALAELAGNNPPVVWLSGLSCSGCSVSFLNATYPDPAAVLTQMIGLDFHPVLSSAAGQTALQALDRRLEAGDYLLVVEGAVPAGMPSACHVGEENFTDLLKRAAGGAKTILAVGTCAAFGGIPAAPPNPTGAVSVSQFLENLSLPVPLINLPGCPVHPDWLVGTLVHLLKFGSPALNEQKSPEMFFGSVIHTRCPEFYNYNIGKYAEFFGDEGCLFKLGCLGIRTFADCATRGWNNRVNWCVGAAAPCIGCASPGFAQDKNYPFYRVREFDTEP